MIAALVDAAISHKRTVLSILVLILTAGAYAYATIPKESSPDIDIPQIYVSMHLEGISPEDGERLLIRPVEQEVASIEGVKEMRSAAYQGGAYVLLEFQAGFDSDKAKDDVQEAVDRAKPDLPEDAEEPDVREVNFSLFPVLVVTLSGDVSERILLRLARDLQDEIESLSAVLEANIAGDRDEQVEIIIDPELLESYGLDGNDILTFFNRSNRLVAAGNLDTGAGRFAIEVPGLFETVHDLLDMPVRASAESTIRLRDVAEIRRTFKDPESFARLDGKPAIALEVVKRTGENVIDTIEAIRQVVEHEKTFWPQGVDVTFTQDQSEDIRTMLSDLQNNMISAVLLVMIVILAALGVRSAGLVGLAIPGAFLSGVLLLYIMGLTVNVVVLFALILSVGMLVDGAIVISEYADRKLSEGRPKGEAYALASKRMAWPIIASTATTLAAFMPLLFWPGLVGEFMMYLPLTLIAVLTSSLFMALIFVPTVGALVGKAGDAANPETMKALAAAEHGDLSDVKGFTGWYLHRLEWALKRPGLILGGCVLLLLLVVFAYGKFGRGLEFFPDIEPVQASVLVHARGNLSVHEKDALVREVESRILNIQGVESFYTRSGESNPGSDLAEDVIGQIRMEFLDWELRPPAEDILAEIRNRTKDIPGIQIETQKSEEGPPTGKDIQIQLSSRDPDLLHDATQKIVGALEKIGGFVAIEDSRPLPGIQWEMKVDRAQAAKFGVDLTTIGYYIRIVTNGLQLAEYRPDDAEDEIDIVLRHTMDERTLDMLDRVRIETAGGPVPIGSFVERIPKPAVGTINRVDGKRAITVKADVSDTLKAELGGGAVNAKTEEIRAWLDAHRTDLDPQIEITFKGQDEDQQEAQNFLVKAFTIALFVMAIILVTQFNSFYSAALILTAVVMSTIGVLIGLIVTQQPFGIVMSGVGVIALAGIIVNNNIVLIDTFDHIRRQYGYGVREAILRTGAQRLRPVLLTTITTILGLLPMVLQLNIDFISREISHGAPSTQWWVQLSTAVVFGLAFSTLLTLIMTPSALMLRRQLYKRYIKVRIIARNRFERLHRSVAALRS